MTRPTKILLASGVTIALLFSVLVVHIHLVTKDKPASHLANIQLARIDFTGPITEQEGRELRSLVAALPGVQHARFNAEAGNIVYAYDRSKQEQTAVLKTVSELTDVPCRPLVVSAAELASSCPAMEKGGAQDRLGQWIIGLLN